MTSKLRYVKVYCSCLPGLEKIAIQECKEKLNLECEKELRGRFSVNILPEDVSDLTKLRAINHFWVVVDEKDDFLSETIELEKTEEITTAYPSSIKWENALDTWKIFKCFLKTFEHPTRVILRNEDKNHIHLSAADSNHIKNNYENIDALTCGEDLSFRVSTTRTGKHKFFNSQVIDRCIGAGINDLFHWKVNLKHYDIKVVVHVLDSKISVGIQLTEDCQALRNITHFGPTNLRANIAYCLLRLADVNPGDIVCDPMCGGGSISLEGSLALAQSFHIASDNHEKAVANSADNYAGIEKQYDHDGRSIIHTVPMSVFQGDVYHLPLRTASIDKIVTDLPFGKKIGSRDRNMFLYANALSEMARVCRPQGKAVLLTQDKKAMWRAVPKAKLWKLCSINKVHMGGIDVNVYLLKRTDDKFSEEANKKKDYPKNDSSIRKSKNSKFSPNEEDKDQDVKNVGG